MADDKVKRRLTTVLCADVQGYSRLMEADETGTLATLRRHRAAMAGLIERHDGRIVNTWGDAVIAEFASVVEAVQCAVEIQQEVSSQEQDATQGQRMQFRIGINLGDVMVEGADIYGDGVNIAARLQELAEPGGIMVSGPVYDQVHNKLSVGFDHLGQQPMKNVAPVTAYRVALAGGTLERRAVVGDNSPDSGRNAGAQPSTPMGTVSHWLANLPRDVTTMLVIAGFLILINAFTGLHRIWFHWPVAALLFIVIMRMLRRRGPGPGRNEDR